MTKKFGKWDVVFLAALLVLGIALTAGVYRFSKAGSRIDITVDGQLYGTYLLSEPQEIQIELDGRTANVVVIEDGAAYMKEADCPDGLCRRQGAVSRSGQTIVCLPHRLVVEVIGGDGQEYDAVSG